MSKPRDESALLNADIPEGLQAILDEIGRAPPRVDGHANPEHYRRRLARLSATSEWFNERGGAIPFNLESAHKMIYREAELAGIDAKSLADARSEGDKIRDAAEMLKEIPDAVWEVPSAELRRILEEMESAKDLAKNLIDSRRKPMTSEEEMRWQAMTHAEKQRERRGKALCALMRGVLRARELASNPNPPGVKNGPWWEATHVLRVMLYVGRSNMTKSRAADEAGGATVFLMAPHLVRYAVDTWEARNGVQYDQHGPRRGVFDYKGVVLIAPMGHSKTEYAEHWLGTEIAMNHRTQAAYLHAIEEKAIEPKEYVHNLFRTSTASGRRMAALFGRVEFDRKDNNSTTMRLRLDRRLKSPTLQACGVMKKGLGGNTNIQIWDDVVPQSDRDSESERERRKKQLHMTWASRQRGNGTFILAIGTLWHNDDALSELVKQGKKGSFLISVQRTGGPTSSPPFFPLWPEVYPAAELRKKYNNLRDRALWAACYEANPIAEDMRVVKRIRFYDPDSPEHRRFVDSCFKALSLDPAATAKVENDKAGFLYAGIGEVSVETDRDGVKVREYQNRVRILQARQFHATQSALVTEAEAFLASHAVDSVLVETRGGYHATAEMFENRYGLPVERRDPTNTKKLQRLKQCAGLIEHGNPGIDAVVEFPGKWNEDRTELVPDENFRDLYKQILDFGIESEDHLIDTLTQLLIWAMEEGRVTAGVGMASALVRRAVAEAGDSRLLGMYKQAEAPENHRKTVEEEDGDFLCNRLAPYFGATLN